MDVHPCSKAIIVPVLSTRFDMCKIKSINQVDFKSILSFLNDRRLGVVLEEIFRVRYLALSPLFSVMNDFGCFRIGSLHKNMQLMLEFLKTPFLLDLIHLICLITLVLVM